MDNKERSRSRAPKIPKQLVAKAHRTLAHAVIRAVNETFSVATIFYEKRATLWIICLAPTYFEPIQRGYRPWPAGRKISQF